MKIVVEGVEQLGDAAIKLLQTFKEDRIFAFYGKMGAGKTTFIKALCDQLEVMDVVTSPTFALVNEYLCENGDSVFHFDFYRIKKASEAVDIGWEEYVYSGYHCLIEWPEMIDAVMPEEYVKVRIDEQEDGSRLIEAVVIKA